MQSLSNLLTKEIKVFKRSNAKRFESMDKRNSTILDSENIKGFTSNDSVFSEFE